MTPTLVALGLGLALGSAGPPALDVRAYRAHLASIEKRLLANDRAGAADEARSVLEHRVDYGTQTLPPDRHVLERIADAAQPGVVAPLQALLASLAVPSPLDGAGPKVDQQALAALALRQAERAASGALTGPTFRKLTFGEVLTRWLKQAASWLGERLRELVRWLERWFARHPAQQNTESSPGLVPLVLVGAGLVLVTALLAFLLTLKKREPGLQATAPGPAPSDADVDPLSRTASEWEQRARALAASGQSREAIRAWYHALLVSCYRAGLLHHRTGWTNTEYARALGADVPWRGRFEELTGRFDVEWYGRLQSSPEALDAFAGEADAILGDIGRTSL